ncbi:carbohydrate-binding domain-containing protein [Streptococcus merionis]|uniref:carbohydrate-binding domain-containing protein n=1 Tax=Streptococcus merionis TaxID=400065 RepID=UPI003512609C
MTFSKTLKKLSYSLVCGLTLLVTTACVPQTTSSSSSTAASNTASKSTTDTNSSIASSADIDWSSLPTTEVSLSDDGLTITDAGTYILSGKTTGGVRVKATGNVRIILAGATISSADNAALYVESAENTVIELQDGTTNTVSDATVHSDTTIEGAIYSKDDLFITGNGSLSVEGNYQDGIVSNDNLTIEGGNIKLTATDDGIRGKDAMIVTSGTISISAGGDGLKATNSEDTAKGYTHITGGTITVEAGDDAIKAESSLTVDGGEIKVTSSVEALEGANVTINGGTIDVYASDDAINASSSVSSNIFIKITGGHLKIEVGQGDTDAIDSNGDLFISGGTVDITAQSAFDYDGVAEFTGGTLIVNGQTQTQITATGPGGRGGGPAGGGGRPSW